MSFSTADKTRLESKTHDPGPLTVNVVPLQIVAWAQINQASFTYPVAQLTVDNTSADWLTETRVGRLVLVGTAPGLADVTYGIVRLAPGATTLYIDPKYPGESGYSRDIRQAFDDDYYVSIVKFRPAWGNPSSIRNKVFYKFWDQTYSDQGKNPRPIIGLGPHQQAFVDSTSGLARFTITVDAYYWSGRSYSAHAWDADGATIIESDAAHLVVDCEPGCYEIEYEATDTKGKITTAYRYLFANNKDRTSQWSPLNYRYPLTDVESPQERNGLTMSLTFGTPFASGILFPGQLVLVTEDPTWGGEALDDMSDVAWSYVGYTSDAALETSKTTRQTTINMMAPCVVADRVPIEKQYIQEQKNPTDWSQVTSLLSNPVGVFYYLCAHHAPYLIDGHDFEFDSYVLNLRRKIHNMNRSDTLGGQLQQLAGFLDGEGNIGSRTDGTTRMLRHPNYFSTSARNALATRWTWQPWMHRKTVGVTLNWRPKVGKAFAGAFAYNGSSESAAFRSMAPGYVRSQGGGEMSLEDTTVVYSAFSQDRVDEIVGFYLAKQNALSEMQPFTVFGNLDVAQPCDLDEWHVRNIAASYDPLGEGWTSQRFLPIRVLRRWSGPGNLRKEIEITPEVETFGYPGIPVPVNRGGATTWLNAKIPDWFERYHQIAPELGISLVAMTAWNGYTLMGLSYNFGDRRTAWSFVRGKVVDATVNKQSDYFTIGTSEPLEVEVLTYDEDAGSLSLYTIADLIDDPTTMSLVETFSLVDIAGTFRLHARVFVSDTTANYWLVAWKNREGTTICRSQNAGVTWETPLTYGTPDPIANGYGEIEEPIAIALYGSRLVFVAPHDSSTVLDSEGGLVYYVYTTSSPITAPSRLTNPTDFSASQGGIALIDTVSAIVGMIKKAAPDPVETLDVVTFQDFIGGDGYTQYSVSYDGATGGINNFAGVCRAYSNFTGGGGANSTTVTVTVDLTAYYQFESVALTYAYSISAGATNVQQQYRVYCLDDGGNVIASYEVPWFPGGTGASTVVTVTAEQLALAGEYVSAVRIAYECSWDTLGSAFTVYLDDIDITATLVEYSTTRTLFSLNPSTGTYTERNSLQRLPFNTYGIAVDSADPNNIYVIARDEDGNQPALLKSSNAGVSYSKVRDVPGLVGLKVSDQVAILFGYNRLEMSADAGDTSYDMLGDWIATVGPVGLIRGIAGVL